MVEIRLPMMPASAGAEELATVPAGREVNPCAENASGISQSPGTVALSGNSAPSLRFQLWEFALPAHS